MDSITKGVETLLTRMPSGKKRRSRVNLTCLTMTDVNDADTTSHYSNRRKTSVSSILSSCSLSISRTLSGRSSFSDMSLQGLFTFCFCFVFPTFFKC